MRDRDEVLAVLSGVPRCKERLRYSKIGIRAVLAVVLTGAAIAGFLAWPGESTPITATHASQLSALVADVARTRNIPPQTLWSGLKRHTGAYVRDNMTEADYAEAVLWLKSQAPAH